MPYSDDSHRIELALRGWDAGSGSVHSVTDVDHKALAQQWVAVMIHGRGDPSTSEVSDSSDIRVCGVVEGHLAPSSLT